MSVSTAWLLDLPGGSAVAAGQRELVHLAQQPRLHILPQAANHARYLLVWQRRLLPALDLAVWAAAAQAAAQAAAAQAAAAQAAAAQAAAAPLAAVVAYQTAPGETPEHGVLLLHRPPQLIQVDGSQGCRLPAELDCWRAVSKACFRHADDRVVPVIDLRKLFTTPPAVWQTAPRPAWLRPGQKVEVA